MTWNYFEFFNKIYRISSIVPSINDREDIIKMLVQANYDFPIYLPVEEDWRLPKKQRTGCFLLDKENRLIYTGDPVREDNAYERLMTILG